MQRALILVISLSAGGTAAQAATMAAGGLLSVGSSITCAFYNAGTSAVSFSGDKIIAGNGALLPLQEDTCTAGLNPATNCFFRTHIAGFVPVACQATVSDAAGLRGVMNIYDSNNNQLVAVPIEPTPPGP
jgi:hypothetical protein